MVGADGSGARLGQFLAFDGEVLEEEAAVVVVLVEVLRCEYSGEDGYLGVELHSHQAGDHGIGYELMAVDAAVHHETCGGDGGVALGTRQSGGEQRNLEGTGYFMEVDIFPREAERGDLGEEGIPALINQVSVPAGLDERNPWRWARAFTFGRWS